MKSRNSGKNHSQALMVAVLVLAGVSAAAWWPPRFVKKMTRPPLETGVAAPQFELESVSGETVSLQQFKGNAVLLKFWSVG